MNERKKILWLVSWYPNKYDAFDGDFIQRHAKAAALHHDIHVLFVKQSEEQKEKEESVFTEAGLTEQIIYLPKRKGLRRKLQNFQDWKNAFRMQTGRFINNCRPSLVHVHIPWKAGLIALWAKKKFGVPYIVTEHWGIYNDIVDDNIHTKLLLVRKLLKRIYTKAAAFVSVSDHLGKGVNTTLVKKEYSVIPNAVDTALFHSSEKKEKRFTFIHVSNMVPLKNIKGILNAFRKFLLQTNADAHLVLIGNKDDTYERLARRLNLPETSVSFEGEIPYPEVAKAVQRAHVFVLNSNIENSPCVIGEALCCGLPVIATNVGGIPELIDETNGVLVSPQNNDALTQAMKSVHQAYLRYNTHEIASFAQEKFSYSSIGAAFSSLYSRLASLKA